jgi:hypothetical protein
MKTRTMMMTAAAAATTTAALIWMGAAIPSSETQGGRAAVEQSRSGPARRGGSVGGKDDGLIRELAPAGLAFSNNRGRCAMRIVASGPERVPESGIDELSPAGPSSIIRTMSYEGNVWQSRRLKAFEEDETGAWTRRWRDGVERRWGRPTAVLEPANGNCTASMIVVYASSKEEIRQRKPASRVLPGVQCPPVDCIGQTVEHDTKVYKAGRRYLQSLASCAKPSAHPTGRVLYVYALRMPGGLVIEYVSSTDHDAETAAYFAGKAPRMCPGKEAELTGRPV